MATMNDDKRAQAMPATNSQMAGHSLAEQKRRVARRLFLRGTVAGSGIVIATMYHQRASAQTKILASSPEACFSLTGVRSTTITEVQSMGRTKQVFDCTGRG
jgi:hypothetical protein